jgi:uncharacterized cupin superfamily protein
MSIAHFKNTAQLTLTDSFPVAVPLSEPVAQITETCVDHGNKRESGIWECTPGTWRRQITQQEFCHFISGRCTFTPDDGEPIEIKAGDAIMFPENSLGIWDIHETVRKSYILL